MASGCPQEAFSLAAPGQPGGGLLESVRRALSGVQQPHQAPGRPARLARPVHPSAQGDPRHPEHGRQTRYGQFQVGAQLPQHLPKLGTIRRERTRQRLPKRARHIPNQTVLLVTCPCLLEMHPLHGDRVSQRPRGSDGGPFLALPMPLLGPKAMRYRKPTHPERRRNPPAPPKCPPGLYWPAFRETWNDKPGAFKFRSRKGRAGHRTAACVGGGRTAVLHFLLHFRRPKRVACHAATLASGIGSTSAASADGMMANQSFPSASVTSAL